MHNVSLEVRSLDAISIFKFEVRGTVLQIVRQRLDHRMQLLGQFRIASTRHALGIETIHVGQSVSKSSCLALFEVVFGGRIIEAKLVTGKGSLKCLGNVVSTGQQLARNVDLASLVLVAGSKECGAGFANISRIDTVQSIGSNGKSNDIGTVVVLGPVIESSMLVGNVVGQVGKIPCYLHKGKGDARVQNFLFDTNLGVKGRK